MTYDLSAAEKENFNKHKNCSNALLGMIKPSNRRADGIKSVLIVINVNFDSAPVTAVSGCMHSN